MGPPQPRWQREIVQVGFTPTLVEQGAFRYPLEFVPLGR